MQWSAHPTNGKATVNLVTAITADSKSIICCTLS